MKAYRQGGFYVAENDYVAVFGADLTSSALLETSHLKLEKHFHSVFPYLFYCRNPDTGDEALTTIHTEPSYGSLFITQHGYDSAHLLFSTPHPRTALLLLGELMDIVGMTPGQLRDECVECVNTVFPEIYKTYITHTTSVPSLPPDLAWVLGSLSVFLKIALNETPENAKNMACCFFKEKILAAQSSTGTA